MKNNLHKVIVIVGPTASGKSDLAVHLAKQIGGEIISADSRQVYKGLNIGSGKITQKEMGGVRHHMLDVANPRKVYSVEQYAKEAKKAVAEIIARKRVPIIAGGTGFYIEALIEGTSLPEVPPDKALREKLAKKTTEQLFTMLSKLDKTRAKSVDKKNRVRLIRAIEIAEKLGKVPKRKSKKNFDAYYIGVATNTEMLKAKIAKRLKARMKAGMLAEAKLLHKQGLSWKRMRELGLEYRFMAEYLTGKMSKQEMLEKLEIAINQYAKRQMTWFKRNKEIQWVSLS